MPIGAPRVTGPGQMTREVHLRNPDHYRAYHREYGARRYQERRGWYKATMFAIPCASCGERSWTLRHRDPESMEFIPSLRSISYNSTRFLAEMSKTVALCRNCTKRLAHQSIRDLPTVDTASIEPPPW